MHHTPDFLRQYDKNSKAFSAHDHYKGRECEEYSVKSSLGSRLQNLSVKRMEQPANSPDHNPLATSGISLACCLCQSHRLNWVGVLGDRRH